MRRSTDIGKKHVQLIVAGALLVLATGICAQETCANPTETQSDKPSDAEAFYKPLLGSDTTGDSYAGLAEALCRQGKVLEARDIIVQARNKGFTDNPKVLAAAGFVSCAQAEKAKDFARRDLYLEASKTLCERALQTDPSNKLALETLIEVEKNRRSDAKLFNDANVVRQSQAPVRQGDFGSNKLFYVPGVGLTNHKESSSRANGKAQ